MNGPVILSGTSVREAPKRRLTAGALEATFDTGALRWIRWNGVEILRAILFLVRTPGWGTPAPVVTDLSIDESSDGFHIRYNAYYDELSRGVLAQISLEGGSDGTVRASADIRADAPFSTNRTGFVILHPLDGFAGTKVDVEHATSGKRRLTIPAEISPRQPVMDIRSIAHSPRPGLTITTRFEGDVFEMEDHRNWSDASFKTYSRPIGLPYPYVLDPARPSSQSVTVTISDDGVSVPVLTPITVPVIHQQTIPAYALPLDNLDDAKQALQFGASLAMIRPARILLRYDPARGDTTSAIEALADLLLLTGASLEVQAIVAGDDPVAAQAEFDRLAQALRQAGIKVAEISAFAKIDEQSFQPGEARPPHLPETAIATALARTFPHSRLGGGSPAFFTEFNRKRPDPALWDFLTFATTPTVHAADDASVIETLQSLPHILNAATHMASGRPLAIGPIGIGARLNPYGAAPVNNHPDEREGMATQDPRQRALFAAAWHVGYLAQLARWGVERFAFGAPTGPFGLISLRQPYARAVWDEWPEGAFYPLYHVARWISDGTGGRLLAAGMDGKLAQVGWEKNGQRQALFANLTPARICVDLNDYPGRTGHLLDETGFEDASLRPHPFSKGRSLPESVLIGAYGVLHIDYGVSP